MKILTALLTVLSLLGIAGVAFAECVGHQTTAQQQTDEDPILFPPKTDS